MPYPVAVTNLTLIQGEDSSAWPQFALTNEDTSAFDLTGWTLTCQFRRVPSGGVVLTPTVAVIGAATDGVLEIQFTSAQSFALSGTLKYDIFGTHASDGQRRLVQGEIGVEEAITRA